MIVYHCRTCANRDVSDKDGAICPRYMAGIVGLFHLVR